MRHAVVNQQNKVVNVIIWEGSPWQPPKDHYVVRSDKCDIGDTYDPATNSFRKPKTS
jgi:hypothetical protein